MKPVYFVSTMPLSLRTKFIFQGMVSRKDAVIIGIVRAAVKFAPAKNMGALSQEYAHSLYLLQSISQQSQRRGEN